MSNTRRGHDTERRCAVDLMKSGYDVIRSAASKSIWDLIAIGPFDVLLIQCKRTKKNIPSCIAPSKVLAEMQAAPAPNSGIVSKQLWTWVDRHGWTITEVASPARAENI